jgi:nucleoside-diphosphate-sugar epimerase
MIAAVTGADGFIGRHLVRRFVDAGWETRPVVRKDYEQGKLHEVLRGAAVVVHAAGATRASAVEKLRASNVDLAKRTLNAAVEGGVSRLVLVSSQAAAGPATSLSTPVDEDTPPAPVEAYGQSKLDAERVVLQMAGIETVAVRPAAVYGPGDRDFLALFRLATSGMAIHPANRNHWLSIIHADDVADAVLACSTSNVAAGETYFVANDEPVQWRDLFILGAKCAERRLWLDVSVPEPVVKVGAAIGDLAAAVTGRASLLTSGKLALSRAPFWVCSSRKARRDLSFSPQVELQRGFAETYAWYRANTWL